MKVQVFIRLKNGVLDVQGKAIENGINGLGLADVSNVRVGKLIELEVKSKDADSAKKEAEEMCKKLLANTVIENYEIRIAQ
jgi:phosphoribosylformylglycinamidine synthase PurS subunit